MFLAALEATVVGTAMPTIIASLGGLDRYSWVFSAFLLASTVTVPGAAPAAPPAFACAPDLASPFGDTDGRCWPNQKPAPAAIAIASTAAAPAAVLFIAIYQFRKVAKSVDYAPGRFVPANGLQAPC